MPIKASSFWGETGHGPCGRTISAGSGLDWRGWAGPCGSRGWRQDAGEFEIDDAEPAVGLAVRHVPDVGIVVAHAEGFEFGEQLLRAFGIEVFARLPQVVVTIRRAFGSASISRGTKVQPRDWRWRRTRTSLAKRSAALGP